MASRYEIRLAGAGGQGLQLAGLILAEAAAIYDGKNAMHTQSYGAQQRGGPSESDVIVSDEEIDYPGVLEADLLLAMTQDACDQHAHVLKRDGILVVDSSLVDRVPRGQVYRLPITETARSSTGRTITASIVALGAITELTGVVSRRAIMEAVAARAPRGTEQINRQALEAGFAAVNDLKATRTP